MVLAPPYGVDSAPIARQVNAPPNRGWPMILNALVERVRCRSKADFKGRRFEATLILQAVSWRCAQFVGFAPGLSFLATSRNSGHHVPERASLRLPVTKPVLMKP